MGYDVHVARSQSLGGEAGPAISRAERVEYVASDPDMRLDGFVERTMPSGETLRLNDPGIATWTGHPAAEHGVPMRLSGWGDVVVANPDETVLRKLWLIAQAFGARVVGQEGETYGPDGAPHDA